MMRGRGTGAGARPCASAENEGAVFSLEVVDMDAAVGRLGRNVFVKGVPCDALDVVRVFCQLAHTLSCSCVVNTGNIVHGAGQNVVRVWGPGQVVNLRDACSTYPLDFPSLSVVKGIFGAKGVGGGGCI